MTWILLILSIILPILASLYINNTAKRSSKIANSKEITGAEVARKLLDKNGLKESYVVKVKGKLTDHYDPRRKVVRLSTAVYEGTSITSVAVAAHEVGHALQDKEGQLYYKIRQFLAPVASLGSKAAPFAIMIGIFANLTDLLWLGIFLLGGVLIFQVATLPVEFGASDRAVKELEDNNLITDQDVPFIKRMLTAAALTYVAAVLTTALNMVWLILANRD